MAPQIGLAPSPAMTPEDYEKLLHHSYLVTSEAHQKILFFFQEDRRVSSTLILLDLIKNFNHPVAQARYKDPKKGRPANNLLCLLADSSWNQDIIKYGDGAKYKAFLDWGAHSVHVSDLLCFRSNFFNQYSYDRFLLCYDDIEEKMRLTEYWLQIK